jgi:splicing factor 3A subunit 1
MPMPPIPAALATPPTLPPPPMMFKPPVPPPTMPPAALPPPPAALPPTTFPPSVPPPHQAPVVDEADESASKRPRVDPSTGLMSESAYAASISLPLVVTFTVPSDMGDCGQVSMSFDDILLSVKDVKDRLAAQYLGGLAANKFQLKSATVGFLKDRLSLAHYNIRQEEVLEVSRKKR